MPKSKIIFSFFKTASAVVLFFITSISCSNTDNSDSIKTPLFIFNAIEEYPIHQNQQLDNWDTTGWGVYEDIIFEGTTIQYNISHDNSTLNTTTLKTEITGGDAYNNVFFTNTVAKRWEQLDWFFEDAVTFEYSLDFFPQVGINCSTSDLSEVEGLEFTMQHVKIPESWGWGIQWSKTNTWSYWDDNTLNNDRIGWVNIPNIDYCILPNTWNSIKITGQIIDHIVSYDTLALNGASANLDIQINNVNVAEDWFENFIQVGFQINGNDAILTDHTEGVDPVKIFLDDMQLVIFD